MIETNSYVIRKEQCPKCASVGNDKSNDNLLVYSDGHSYCFAGHGIISTGDKLFKLRKENQEVVNQPVEIYLPHDVTLNLPYITLQWLRQYELTDIDIKRNICMWSESESRLIFPYFSPTGLIAWQGRYFGNNAVGYRGSKKIPKWYSTGKIHEFVHPLNVRHRLAVLVEDIVSAIKLSNIIGAIPLFGSQISKTQLLRIRLLCDRLLVWLDKDKQKEAVKIANRLSTFGIKSQVIITDKDPKEVPLLEIKRILNEAL